MSSSGLGTGSGSSRRFPDDASRSLRRSIASGFRRLNLSGCRFSQRVPPMAETYPMQPGRSVPHRRLPRAPLVYRIPRTRDLLAPLGSLSEVTGRGTAVSFQTSLGTANGIQRTFLGPFYNANYDEQSLRSLALCRLLGPQADHLEPFPFLVPRLREAHVAPLLRAALLTRRLYHQSPAAHKNRVAAVLNLLL